VSMLPVVLLLSVVSAALQLPLDPTHVPDQQYIEQRKFTSPITGESFHAPVLKSEVQAASFDYDRCPHPPFNVFAYTLVIDPATGYVAYPELFENQCPWNAESLAEILGAPKFKRNVPESLPWTNAYPWEKFENAARLAQAAEYPSLEIANWWILAAWSVRLDVISGYNEFDAEVAAVFERLPQRGPDPTDLLTLYELALAEQWEQLRAMGQLTDVNDAEFALALAWLYRSRGELVPALDWLGRAALHDEQLPEESLLYRYLQSSIELERDYLKTTRQWLLKGWNGAEVPPVQQGGTAYLLGEINRRLGDNVAAIYWYSEAETYNRGALSPDLIKHQRALAESRRAF